MLFVDHTGPSQAPAASLAASNRSHGKFDPNVHSHHLLETHPDTSLQSINKETQRYDITPVYTHPEASVDIVLVHGLNGHPFKTWQAKNGVFWPTDLLPRSLRDRHANVLVYGYNADVYSRDNDRSPSDNFVHQHAQTLVMSLTSYRKEEDCLRRPIVWVAHSLGGILVKRALLYSNDLRSSDKIDDRNIFVSTYGVIFLGTPHAGSDLATWGHVLQAMSDVVVPRRIFDSEPVLLRTLKRDNETLQNINSHFLDIYQRFQIHMAHENHKTDIKGTKYVSTHPLPTLSLHSFMAALPANPRSSLRSNPPFTHYISPHTPRANRRFHNC